MSTLMVVDDDERVRTFLTRSLSAQGHKVVPARDGQDALEQLPAAEVDLVLLDLVMPGSTDFSCCRARERTPDPPVSCCQRWTGRRPGAALDRGASTS